MLTDPRAEAYSADGGPVGVLLSHGFTGSPVSIRPWAEHLAAAGLTVASPRLPGHATTWQELSRTSWQDWYAEVSAVYERLRRRCDAVVVGGLSMGGALALRLAEEHPEQVAGVVLVNPSVASADKRMLAVPVARHLVRSVKGIGNDIKKPGVDEGCYERTPLRAVHSMTRLWRVVQADLAKVVAPVLVFRSAEDHVVDPLSSRMVVDGVSSTDVTQTVLHDSYHVATLDNDAPRIFAESLAFIRRVAVAPIGAGDDGR